MNVKLINLSKLFFAIYLIYTYVVRQRFLPIPIITYILLPLAVICFLIRRFKMRLNLFLGALIVYLFYCFLIGVFISVDINTTIKACINLLEYIIIFWLTYEYSHEDNSIDFVCNIYILLAIFYAFTVLLFGVGSQRISISENTNVNTIAQVMVFAIGFRLYKFTKFSENRYMNIIGVAEIVLFLYIIAVTASKMAIICSLLLILLWFLFCFAKSAPNMFIKKILILALTTLLFIGFVKYYPEQYEYILSRMHLITSGRSTTRRLELIKEALGTFFNHPLFGVGINNFRFYTSMNTYSHCFYSEVLACTGVIGAFLLGVPMCRLLLKLIRKVKEASDRVLKKQALSLLFVYIIFLILISAQIYIYAYQLMFALAIINSASYLDRNIEGTISQVIKTEQ